MANVRSDRNAMAETPAPFSHTRVISIVGPKKVVTVENSIRFFPEKFVYEIDDIVPLVTGKVINILEFYLGSYRCQDQWAWRNIREDPVFQGQGVRVNV